MFETRTGLGEAQFGIFLLAGVGIRPVTLTCLGKGLPVIRKRLTKTNARKNWIMAAMKYHGAPNSPIRVPL
ncbi:MAG TPA: hypothetical protein VFN01_11270 [Marinobacter sp.]|uniref:hypothetical protein n=1 Tax=Marinobacter sp. TaxID=50741 RepID=UPI00261C7F5A|nr:hypothetical protein [Marinobacter sp.]HET8801751.1 hypothetical protein [Marinobacter sp.]